VRRGHLVLLLSAALGPACSSSDSGGIQLVTGGETDTFTRAPAPTRLRVDAVDPSGKVTTLSTTSLPATTIDLGSHSENTVSALNVTGLDATGNRVVFGASLPLFYGGLAGVTLPVFVQRVGELARLPGALSDARHAPLLAQVQGQYLFVGGGTESATATTTQLYDYGALAPLPSPPTLPFAPQSVAFVGTVAWLFSASGTASYYDFSTGGQATIPPLAGGSFADVTGGATVAGDGGVQFIVGATRTSGAPTAAVLQIDAASTAKPAYLYGGPTWLTLTAPRLGASSAWVTGRGLVVVGGSASAAGAEIVAPGATKGSALPFPPDDSVDCGATALDNQTVLVAGGISATVGSPGVRAIDLRCSSQCAPVAWEPSLPVASAQAFTIDPASALVVGSEFVTGATHVFRVTTAKATEIPTKVPRAYARAIWSPVGSVLLVGGASLVESFVF
jgi:hypothetical protein